MAHIVIEHVGAQGFLRGQLGFLGNGGVNHVAIVISVVAITFHHLLTHHFGQIRRRKLDMWSMIIRHQRLSTRLIVLGLRDVFLIQHTRQYGVATRQRTIVRIQRIEG
ncbi:hypothetical protein SRABI106_01696 [Rahnella aquatilis]|nr:hypothetical protein SRABI106_01696 [Rahnella aquatilis]